MKKRSSRKPLPAHMSSRLTGRRSQPLIGVPTGEGVDEVVRPLTSEEEADKALAKDTARIQRALSLAGAWKHLDEEGGSDPLDELDRMRHASKPTPLLKLP